MAGEAGWTPDQYGHSKFKPSVAPGDNASYLKSLTAFMRSLLKVSAPLCSKGPTCAYRCLFSCSVVLFAKAQGLRRQ